MTRNSNTGGHLQHVTSCYLWHKLIGGILTLQCIDLEMVSCDLNWSGHRLQLSAHLVVENKDAFTRESSLSVTCVPDWKPALYCALMEWYDRNVGVVFVCVHFVNTGCRILVILTCGREVTFVWKCTEMCVIWLFTPRGSVYIDMVWKKSWTTCVVLRSVHSPVAGKISRVLPTASWL